MLLGDAVVTDPSLQVAQAALDELYCPSAQREHPTAPIFVCDPKLSVVIDPSAHVVQLDTAGEGA